MTLTIAHKKLVILSLLLVVLAGILAYSSSLSGAFLWDDNYTVKENVLIRSWRTAPALFTGNVIAGAGRQSPFYRPLQIVTYTLDYSIWKLWPFGYHLTNVALHVGAALLVCWLLYILTADFFIAWLAALLFCLHPVHTEAVAYISGRADSLALMCMLLSFIFYLKNTKSIAMIFSVSCFALALLSKELALVLPVLIIMYHVIFKKKINGFAFGAFITVGVCYALLRFILREALAVTGSLDTTFLERLPGFFVAIASYVRLLILPYNLHMEYGSKLFSITDPMAINGVAIFVLLCVIIVALRKPKPIIAFAAGWFLVALIPQSNLFPINAFMAEHWLYVPSIGFCLIAALFLSRLMRSQHNKIITACCIGIYFTALGYLTWQQNGYWKSPTVFFKRLQQAAPESPAGYWNLATIYKDTGKKEESRELFWQALARYQALTKAYPSDARLYNNIGVAYKDLGLYDQALAAFERSIELNPRSGNTYYNVAGMYEEKNDARLAANWYEMATAKDPRCAGAYNNLGGIYYKLGRKEDAQRVLKTALAINPLFVEAYNNLGVIYFETGKIAEAIPYFQKAVSIKTDYTKAYENLAAAYERSGAVADAVAAYKKALVVDSSNATALNGLAGLYYRQGHSEEAIRLLQQAIGIAPGFGRAYENLSIAYFNLGKFTIANAYFKKAKELGVSNPGFEAVLTNRLKEE